MVKISDFLNIFLDFIWIIYIFFLKNSQEFQNFMTCSIHMAPSLKININYFFHIVAKWQQTKWWTTRLEINDIHDTSNQQRSWHIRSATFMTHQRRPSMTKGWDSRVETTLRTQWQTCFTKILPWIEDSLKSGHQRRMQDFIPPKQSYRVGK